jgi:hypothetical protein
MTPEFVSALADIAWPLLFLGLVFYLRRELRQLLDSGSEFAFEFMGNSLTVKPSKAITAGEDAIETEQELNLETGTKGIPADYLYLKHTSFLRQDRQEEFQARTQLEFPHYDIRVIVDSYYKGALDRVDRVEYFLHESYPEPIRVRTSKEDKFLLKEVANGEYVLQARVFLNDHRHPIILQRYLSLWESGPRI